jgi:hypothetical protein
MRRQYPGFRLGPSFAPMPGNIYYVVQTTEAYYAQFVKDYQETYSDGSTAICPHTGTATTVTVNGLKAALAKTVANRNDYVVVMPADVTYCTDELLTMDKKGVHLICPAGFGYEMGATNAARVEQLLASTAIINVTAASVEIAGFYFKNINQAAGITLAATAYAPNIHNNSFALIWTSGAQVGGIVGTGAGGGWGAIEHNALFTQTGNGCTCAAGVIQIGASATDCRVNYNEVTIGDKQIATIGINNAAVKGHTDFNLFSECGGIEQTAGGTITKCISVAADGCAIGNIGAVGTGQMLTGGTTLHSFAQNKGGFISATYTVAGYDGSVEA